MKMNFSRAALVVVLVFVSGTSAVPAGDPPRFHFETSRAGDLPFRNSSGGDDQLAIVEQNGQGICTLDFDGDGWMDLYFVNGSTLEGWKAGNNPGGRLFRNSGHRTFIDVTGRAGVPGPSWGTGCASADYDGDGRPDLFVAGWQGSKLFRNLGGGRFEDVTVAAGIDVPGWASCGAFADFDGDGRLDLAVSRYVDFDFENIPAHGPKGEACTYRGVMTGCEPLAHPPLSTMLFRQKSGGRFEDVSVSSGLAAVPTRGFGVAALPLFQNSRLPDLYVACDQMENRLFRNRSKSGEVRFEEVAGEMGAALSFEGKPESGMGLSAGDVWEEGRPDLFTTNFAGEKNTLYRNLGDRYEDRSIGTGLESHRSELGWGNALVDLDGDSHLDAIVANGQIYPQVEQLHDPDDSYAQPIRIFSGDGRGGFTEVESSALTERRSRRALIAVDLDNDGRLDIVTQTHRSEPQIFWNHGGGGNHWIRFRLRGTAPRDPMAARVTIRLPDGSRRTSWHLPNQGYQSSQDPRVVFGLGSFREILSMTIDWPDGRSETRGRMRADRDYSITERKEKSGR